MSTSGCLWSNAVTGAVAHSTLFSEFSSHIDGFNRPCMEKQGALRMQTSNYGSVIDHGSHLPSLESLCHM